MKCNVKLVTHMIYCLFLVIGLISTKWTLAQDFHPILSQGVRGGPGVKLRLTKKGIDYFNGVAANVVAEQLPKVLIPDVRQELPNNQGELRLSNIRINKFKRAQFQRITPRPPNVLAWSINNMDIGLVGDLGGSVVILVPFQLEGQAEILAKDISFSLECLLDASRDGAPIVRASTCNARIGPIDITNHNGGLAGVGVNLFKLLIADQLRPLLQDLICRRAKDFVDRDLNEKLSTTPTRVPLSQAQDMDILGIKKPSLPPQISASVNGPPIQIRRDAFFRSNRDSFGWRELRNDFPLRPIVFRGSSSNRNAAFIRGKRSNSEIVRVKRQLFGGGPSETGGFDIGALFGTINPDTLFIDYRLLRAPMCTSDYIEFENAGEISYLGQGQTPFHPDTLRWHAIGQRPKMFELVISDFLPNSLMYHAFKQRMLRFRVGRDTPNFGQFLRTTCDVNTASFGSASALGSVCFGDLIPHLADTYPNNDIELLFSATRAPAMLFSQRNGGVVSINIKGVLFVYIRENQSKVRQAAVLDIDVVADTRINVTAKRVLGSVTFNRFQLKNKYGNLGLDNSDLNDISFLITEILQSVVNGIMEKGLPIPVPSAVRLVDPRVSVFNRELVIATDLDIDQALINEVAAEALKQGILTPGP